MANTPEKDSTRGGVAEEVRALMGRRKERQADMARLLHLSQSAVSRRLNGEHPFDVDELDAIASHFDVPVTDLFPRPRRPLDSPRYLAAQAA